MGLNYKVLIQVTDDEVYYNDSGELPENKRVKEVFQELLNDTIGGDYAINCKILSVTDIQPT